MAKDYSNAKAEEQMQKGEISPSELQAWNDKMNQMNLKAEQALQETSEILQAYEIATAQEVKDYLGIGVI